MSSAAGQARCPRVTTGTGLGCEWAGCRARREKCWVPEGDMRPELQVAVRCDLGRLSLASAAREVPPDPAPRSCPARSEPLRERPLLAPHTTALSRGHPCAMGQGVGVGEARAVRQGGRLLLSWYWALQKPGCLLPVLNPAPPHLSHPATCHPNTSLGVPEQYSRWAAGGARSLGV